MCNIEGDVLDPTQEPAGNSRFQRHRCLPPFITVAARPATRWGRIRISRATSKSICSSVVWTCHSGAGLPPLRRSIGGMAACSSLPQLLAWLATSLASAMSYGISILAGNYGYVAIGNCFDRLRAVAARQARGGRTKASMAISRPGGCCCWTMPAARSAAARACERRSSKSRSVSRWVREHPLT